MAHGALLNSLREGKRSNKVVDSLLLPLFPLRMELPIITPNLLHYSFHSHSTTRKIYQRRQSHRGRRSSGIPLPCRSRTFLRRCRNSKTREVRSPEKREEFLGLTILIVTTRVFLGSSRSVLSPGPCGSGPTFLPVWMVEEDPPLLGSNKDVDPCLPRLDRDPDPSTEED